MALAGTRDAGQVSHRPCWEAWPAEPGGRDGKDSAAADHGPAGAKACRCRVPSVSKREENRSVVQGWGLAGGGGAWKVLMTVATCWGGSPGLALPRASIAVVTASLPTPQFPPHEGGG